MNGDGKADIGLRSISEGTFYWRLAPDFTVQSTFAWTAGGQYAPIAADFTGDGKADLAVRGSDSGDDLHPALAGLHERVHLRRPRGRCLPAVRRRLQRRRQGRPGPALHRRRHVERPPRAGLHDPVHLPVGVGDQLPALRGRRQPRRTGRPRPADDLRRPHLHPHPAAPAQATPTPVPVTKDADGDHVEAPLDCDDTNPAIRPGATDVPGDGIDQDCSGADATLPALKAYVTFSWGFLGANTVITKILITDLAGGETVKIVCKGQGLPEVEDLQEREGRQAQPRRALRPQAQAAHRRQADGHAHQAGTIGSTTTLTVRKRRQDPAISRRSPR